MINNFLNKLEINIENVFRESYYLERLNKKPNTSLEYPTKNLLLFVSQNHHLVVMLDQLSMILLKVMLLQGKMI